MTFEIGKEYRNRRGLYVVMSIQGNALHVRYQDGSDATLNAVDQERIISNIGMENRPKLPEEADRTSVTSKKHLARKVPKGMRNRHESSGIPPSWNRYRLWNTAIFEYFFTQHMTNQLVYIDIDDDVIASLAPDGAAQNCPTSDFIQAIRDTLGPLGKNLFTPHFVSMDSWKTEGANSPPPCLALLASFCLAAQRMESDGGFSSSNYYARLGPILLGSSYQPNQRQGLQRGFRRAHELWEALDAWLWEKAGKLGLPSAQPMYGLAHVGYPISQSLLRTQDRRKLVGFFWNSDLYPGQQVSAPDFERLLDWWVPRSNLSSAAKNRWSNRSARRKMAEIASLELSTWNGSLPDKESLPESMVTAPMALQVSVVGGPSRRLDWDVVFRIPSDLPEITYEAISDERRLPCNGGPCQSVTVTQGLSSRWSDPISDVSIGDFLVSRVELVEREGKKKVRWQPQKVLALGWDEELKVYRSLPHLEFAKRGMVIAFETVASTVESLLSGVDSGNMKRVPENWGVPQGWAIFDNVQLYRVPDTGGDIDLSPLVPEITSTVEWLGGIAFPGRKQWLSSRLPVINANSIDEVEQLSATVDLKSTFHNLVGNPVQPTSVVAGNALNLNLSGWELPDGVYGLVVSGHQSSAGDRAFDLARQTFEIRSPASRFPLATAPLGYCSDSRLWPLSASTMENYDNKSPTRVVVRGAVVDQERLLPVGESKLPQVLDSVYKHLDEYSVFPSEKLNRTIPGVANCFSGAHYWVFDRVRDLADYYRPHKGVCAYCGKTDIAYPQSLRALLSRESTRPTLPNLPKSQTTKEPVQNLESSGADQVDFDGLLEACFTWGGGTWSHFQLLARQVSLDPWFPYEAVQLFSSLGHLDVEWDTVGKVPLRWVVSPPAVVMTEYEDAFLAGYRSAGMMEVLKHLVESHGGNWTAESNANGPTTYRISDVPPESLRSIISNAKEDKDTNWRFSDRPGQSIANSLPPLWEIVAEGQEVDIHSSSEYFDVNAARWSPQAVLGPDGLYRTNSLPRTYFLKLRGACRQVSYRSGKHLAGAFHRRVLLAYEPRTNQLECPLGAQLPGLYERAVVLSSGSPPELDLRNRRVTYGRVPESVAQAVWSKITDLQSIGGPR